MSFGIELANALPNPGEPGFPAVFATFGAFLGGALAYAQGRPWEEIQLKVFQFGFFATGVAIVVYLIVLVSGA